MKRIFHWYGLVVILAVTAGCQLDDSPLLQPGTINEPDTVGPSPDYRLAFTGMFDISSQYYEALGPGEWYYFTDSVRLAEPGSLGIPTRLGSPYTTKVDSLGHLSTDFQHANIYVTADGHFIGADSFFLHLHMDVQPHTYGYYISGKRQ